MTRPTTPNGLPVLDTAEEVADALGIQVRTVWEYCRAKKVPHVVFARRYRFTHEQYDENVAGATVQPLGLVTSREARVSRRREVPSRGGARHP